MSTKTIARILLYLVLAGVVLVAGLYVGLINLRMAIVNELTESGVALLELNQGYTIAGLEGATLCKSLDLNPAVSDALERSGFEKISDLSSHTEADLRTVPGIDDDAIANIQERLRLHGSSLSNADGKLPISELGVSDETEKALATHKIFVIGDVTSKTETELAKLPLTDAVIAGLKVELKTRGLALMPEKRLIENRFIESVIAP